MKILELLRQETQRLKSFACKLYGNYQSSNTETQKWHALDDICDGLRDVGGMTYTHACLFESCHRKIEIAFRLTSTRSMNVRSGVIERENRRATYGHSLQV